MAPPPYQQFQHFYRATRSMIWFAAIFGQSAATLSVLSCLPPRWQTAQDSVVEYCWPVGAGAALRRRSKAHDMPEGRTMAAEAGVSVRDDPRRRCADLFEAVRAFVTLNPAIHVGHRLAAAAAEREAEVEALLRFVTRVVELTFQ